MTPFATMLQIQVDHDTMWFRDFWTMPHIWWRKIYDATFLKIVNYFQPVTVFVKSSGLGYSYQTFRVYIVWFHNR